ncbi:hypothetical protein M9H77_24428 [Catharanthus roseus]|uniref:Uncharacterized protein n=1 Tax=Catharanthus roseus TaxID=4058 RepID=A0ACC0AXT8_CATRO|nr:hypothetical protein M9H77_24428 [Catharanthus roseus]
MEIPASSHGAISFSSLQRTLILTASPSQGQDSSYKIIKVKLCYEPISQVDRAWKKQWIVWRRTKHVNSRLLPSHIVLQIIFSFFLALQPLPMYYVHVLSSLTNIFETLPLSESFCENPAVLKTGEDKITMTWSYDTTLQQETDSNYEKIKGEIFPLLLILFELMLITLMTKKLPLANQQMLIRP